MWSQGNRGRANGRGTSSGLVRDPTGAVVVDAARQAIGGSQRRVDQPCQRVTCRGMRRCMTGTGSCCRSRRTWSRSIWVGLTSHRTVSYWTPFCGTGTTLVEAKKRGVSSIGLEAMPMTAFAAAAKVDWACDPQQLVEHAEHVATVALDELAAHGISDGPGNREVDEQRLRRLAPDQERLVFKDAISPLPLQKTLVLLGALDRELCAEVDQHARLALASTIVDTASNLKFGPEVGVGKVKFDAPVVSAWLSRVRRMAADLDTVAGNDTSAEVRVADARAVDAKRGTGQC